MNSNLLRNLSFHARRLRVSPTPSLFSLTAPTSFSSRSHSPDKPQPIVEDISNEELKRRVAKLREGDAEAIPSLFEAILQRYLAGKPIEADEELLREILGKKGTGSEDDEEDEFDSDWDSANETENEDEDFDIGFNRRSGVEGKNKR